MHIYNSDIVLVGRVVFEHNYGRSGGAIQLDSNNVFSNDCGYIYASFLN